MLRRLWGGMPLRVVGRVEAFGREPELEPATSSYDGGASDGVAMLCAS